MADRGAAWRDDLEAMLRAAATTMRCALPRDARAALPQPIGRPTEACPRRIPPRSVRVMNEMIAAVKLAALDELREDIVWSRALDLSWKEIMVRHPGIPERTLRWHHQKALVAISRYIVDAKRKSFAAQEDSRNGRRAP